MGYWSLFITTVAAALTVDFATAAQSTALKVAVILSAVATMTSCRHMPCMHVCDAALIGLGTLECDGLQDGAAPLLVTIQL